jgi:hypothetical protein
MTAKKGSRCIKLEYHTLEAALKRSSDQVNFAQRCTNNVLKRRKMRFGTSGRLLGRYRCFRRSLGWLFGLSETVPKPFHRIVC